MIQSSIFNSEIFKQLIFCDQSQKLTADLLVKKIVCDPPTGDCHKRRCSICVGKLTELEEEMLSICEDNNIGEIECEQWLKTDRTAVQTIKDTAAEIVKEFGLKLKKLCEHQFEYRQQNLFIKELRENVPLNTCIAAGDFSENLEFYDSQEVQSGYRGGGRATLFPVILKWNDAGVLHEKACCIISDDPTKHTFRQVYCFLREINFYLVRVFKNRKKMIYISDGAGSQFKSCNNLINVCYHQQDYGIPAEWVFAGGTFSDF